MDGKNIATCVVILFLCPAVSAQSILQGPRGESADLELSCVDNACSLSSGLVVQGSLTSNGEVTGYELTWNGSLDVADGHPLAVDQLDVAVSIDLPECPDGYTLASGQDGITLCQRSRNGRLDEVVRVGGHWVDRSELSLWATACTGDQFGESLGDYPGTFPTNGNWSEPVYACSVTGEKPGAYGSWLQYQQACVLAGKHMCSNHEWQAGAIGPPGPDGLGADDYCNLLPSDGPCGIVNGGNTWVSGSSNGGTCMSTYGAYDMIGNLNEFVARWGESGELWDSLDPVVASYSAAGFFLDGTWNVAGTAEAVGGWQQGWPAALVRGGTTWDGCNGGFMAASHNPSITQTGNQRYGARCCSVW